MDSANLPKNPTEKVSDRGGLTSTSVQIANTALSAVAVRNPAPDASPTREPSGSYLIVEFRS